ncbi:MAG: hypothetical protein HY293_00085 [Planctomycetes bacterium]|nr:hypothetical protein [Planctomycetota bacterium]
MLTCPLAVIALLMAMPATQEDKEPPLVMYLETGGKRIPVEPDKPFDLEAAGKTSCTLRMEPYRIFKYAGLSFQYPRGAAFKTQGEGTMTLWTLNDGNSMLMVQRFKGAPDPKLILKTMVDQMIGQYGKSAEVKQSEAAIELQKTPLKGTRLDVAFANQTILQSLYSFASGKDTIVLVFQDALDDGGKPGKTFAQFQKMVQDSFRFPGK